jgi:hypothetical protein
MRPLLFDVSPRSVDVIASAMALVGLAAALGIAWPMAIALRQDLARTLPSERP